LADLTKATGSGGDSREASLAWERYRVSVDLRELSTKRLKSIEKIHESRLLLFNIGNGSANDLNSSSLNLTEARINNARSNLEVMLSEISLVEISGLSSTIKQKESGWIQGPTTEYEHDVKRIETETRNSVNNHIKKSRRPLGFVEPFPPKSPQFRNEESTANPVSPTSDLMTQPQGEAEIIDLIIDAGKIIIKRVRRLTGTSILRTRDGTLSRLKVGDLVASNDEVISVPGGLVEFYDEPVDPADSPPAAAIAADTTSKPPQSDTACESAYMGTALLPAFRWPPWPPTDAHELDPGPRKTLGEIADFLSSALDRADYANHYGFTALPSADGNPAGGFAIVTDPEQIRPDGKAVVASGRWLRRMPRAAEVDLITFIRGLVQAPPGHYRVIVFTVTDALKNRPSTPLSDDEPLRSMARCGPTKLTNATSEMRTLRGRTVTLDTRVSALIYEFRKATEKMPAEFVSPGLKAEVHLIESRIYAKLSSRN